MKVPMSTEGLLESSTSRNELEKQEMDFRGLKLPVIDNVKR